MRARASTGALAVVAVIAGAVGLGGCAADAEQYQSDAEHFLSGDEVFAAYGIDFRDPVCTVPTSTTVGTSFACTASGDDGLTYDFTMQITGEKSFALTSVTPLYPVPTNPETSAPSGTVDS